MLRKILLVLLLFFGSSIYAADEKSQDDVKVEKTLKKMIRAYKNENLKAFFRHVSENRFQQDFLDFADDVGEDLRVHTILSIDTWVDKITIDGKKRFIYIKWDKRYQSITDDAAKLSKEGTSMFLFDNIKGKYKLIDFSGDAFFGDT